jgi:hypothetical protein
MSAAEQVVIIIRVKDDAATDALARAAEEAEHLGKASEGAGKATEEAGGKSDRWATVLTGLSSGLELARSAAALAAQAITGVAGAISGAVEAYREQEGANRLLIESLSRAGLQGEALESRFDTLAAAAADFADRTAFGDEAIFAGLSKYIQLTGQAEVTTKDLSIILGIAARQQIEAKDAAELYAKAIKGDIGSLIDLVAITKDQEAVLEAIPTSAGKAAAAQKLLAESYAGAAEGGNANFQSIKNLTDATGELTQKVGEVIVESGLFQAVLQPLTKALRLVEGMVEENKEGLQGLILDGLDMAIDAVQSFSITLAQNADFIAGVVTVVRLGVNAFRAMYDIIAAVNKVVFAFVTGALTGVVEGLSQLIRLAALAAEKVDEDLAVSLRGASAAAGEISERLAGLSLGALEGAADNIGDLGQVWENVGEALDDTLPISNKLAAAFGEVGTQAARSRLQVQELRKEIGKEQGGDGKKKPPPRPPASVDGAAKAEEARKKRFEEQIAAIRIAALETEDKRAQAQLELNARLLEIERDRLEGNSRLLATAEATVAYKQQIATLEREAAEAATRAAEEEQKRQEEALRTLAARIEQEQALNDAITSQLDSFAQSGGTLGRVAAGAARLNEVLGKSVTISRNLEAGLIGGAEAAQQAIGVAGGAAVTFASQLGASASEQAGILALFEGAAALASFAVGDLRGGAQHAAAAALYGVVAGTGAAAASSPSGGSAGASTGGSAGSASGASGEDGARRGAQVLAEEIASAMGESSAPIVINYDQRGSFLVDSPAGQRMMFNAAAGGGRQVGVDLEDLKASRQGRRA